MVVAVVVAVVVVEENLEGINGSSDCTSGGIWWVVALVVRVVFLVVLVVLSVSGATDMSPSSNIFKSSSGCGFVSSWMLLEVVELDLEIDAVVVWCFVLALNGFVTAVEFIFSDASLLTCKMLIFLPRQENDEPVDVLPTVFSFSCNCIEPLLIQEDIVFQSKLAK